MTFRVVFIGATKLGLRCLKQLTELPGCSVVGAVTASRIFQISYRPSGVTNVLHADIASYCSACGIPCEYLASGMSDPSLIARVGDWAPDAFLVAGWYHMIPVSWRTLAPAYGLHASLLPDYSGGAPLVWAMINGERQTGVTLFQLANGVDDGPVIDQAATTIADHDTIASLYARIEELALQVLARSMPRLADGTAILRVQDSDGRRLFPQRSPEDGLIDWTQPAERVRNFVRAQTHPYPGAFTHFRGSPLRVWEVQRFVGSADTVKTAEVEFRDGHVVVGCGDTGLELTRLGNGERELSGAEWWRSQGLAAGERLGP
jgi:methionyl-tRNA formyltransferase